MLQHPCKLQLTLAPPYHPEVFLGSNLKVTTTTFLTPPIYHENEFWQTFVGSRTRDNDPLYNRLIVSTILGSCTKGNDPLTMTTFNKFILETLLHNPYYKK